MKVLNKYAAVLPALLVLASISTASQNDDYIVVALDNCEVVSKTQMTPEQLDAYLPLKNAELLIEELQIPLEDMELQLKEYTDQIEEITKLAVQETDGSIYIDKHYLSQQQEIAKQISDIVAFHQLDIDAIEEHSEEIGKKAERFEKAIKKDLAGIEYDQIRILTPEEDDGDYSCHKEAY